MNSSMSAAVPTNIRRSSESWFRVIVPPIGRSHLPIISINKSVWWSAKVQSFSGTSDKFCIKTLACLIEMSTHKMEAELPTWREIHLLHHGFQSRVSFCGRLFSEDDASLTKESQTLFN